MRKIGDNIKSMQNEFINNYEENIKTLPFIITPEINNGAVGRIKELYQKNKDELKRLSNQISELQNQEMKIFYTGYLEARVKPALDTLEKLVESIGKKEEHTIKQEAVTALCIVGGVFNALEQSMLYLHNYQ
ncbi:hypothetical protein KY348_05460 [Candidatus Woesearchaeota archaeon]|nr:hypothetical protein [Candidatus Woesearchaeota archaeon]